MDDLSVFVLAVLTGFAVIGRVPATLHTPLMSGTNAVHGIVLAGAMLMAATADGPVGWALTFVAAAFAGMNVAGGYVVTDRMLAMFRTGPAARTGPGRDAPGAAGGGPGTAGGGAGGVR
jgi:NAD(P) transhydrogenase subunit alpha